MTTSDRERDLTARLDAEVARSRKTTLRIVALTCEPAEQACTTSLDLAEVLAAGEQLRARLKRRLAL